MLERERNGEGLLGRVLGVVMWRGLLKRIFVLVVRLGREHEGIDRKVFLFLGS
jgi:hypothetical protein